LAFATETAGEKVFSHVLQVPRVLSNEIELYSVHLSMIPNRAHSLGLPSGLLTFTATPGPFESARVPGLSHASAGLQKALLGESAQDAHCNIVVARVTL
jgi:hypothetical protein